MASHAHQALLLWAARRMTVDGFVLGGFETPSWQGGPWNALPAPFELHGKRADAWGVRPDDALMAFAEAKTAADIDNRHTRAQLRVFGFTKMRKTSARCPIYIAIPRSCAYALDRVLIDLELIRARHVVRLHVPDPLLQAQ